MSIGTFTSSGISKPSREHLASLTTPAASTVSPSEPFDWMDDFGEPGPEINHSRPHFLKPISPVAEEYRASSSQYIMARAAGSSVQSYNEDLSPRPQSPFGSRGKEVFTRESGAQLPGAGNVRSKTQTDGFVEAKTYGGRKPLATLRERTTLVKGPPGAFYHGLSRRRQTVHNRMTLKDLLESKSHTVNPVPKTIQPTVFVHFPLWSAVSETDHSLQLATSVLIRVRIPQQMTSFIDHPLRHPSDPAGRDFIRPSISLRFVKQQKQTAFSITEHPKLLRLIPGFLVNRSKKEVLASISGKRPDCSNGIGNPLPTQILLGERRGSPMSS